MTRENIQHPQGLQKRKYNEDKASCPVSIEVGDKVL